MYQLYFVPGACSLATQVVLRELNIPVEIIDKNSVPDFSSLNPVGTVPVLQDGDEIVREGAAIMIHVLEKQTNPFLPVDALGRSRAIQDIMFANATMHPAYSKLFFTAQNLPDGDAKNTAFAAAADAINKLWQVVEKRLQTQTYLGGDTPSAADIMLTVYSRWGQFFPADIVLGPRAQAMVNAIQQRPTFVAALDAEQATQQAAA